MTDTRTTGFIRRISTKGFLFISTDGGDLFAHASQFPPGAFDRAQVGDALTFTISTNGKGRCASDVQPEEL